MNFSTEVIFSKYERIGCFVSCVQFCAVSKNHFPQFSAWLMHLLKNTVEIGKVVINETIKKSICKCAIAAAFLGNLNQNILTFSTWKIASKLIQNCKQFTFEPDCIPKLLLRYDLPKKIKHVSETNYANVG